MSPKKVLVCGASGFIGRNLFEYLSKRDKLEVFGTYFSAEGVAQRQYAHNLIQADLRQEDDVYDVIGSTKPDVIVQAAAVTSGAKDIVSNPYIHITDNSVMNPLLLQAVYDFGVSHFIFLSCTVMYPMNRDYPLKETDVDLNWGIHEKYFGGAWVKIYIEKLCEFYSKLGKTRFTVIRHSNIYGPYDKFDLEKSHVFGATVAKVVQASEGGMVQVWGDGSEERDLLYVSDLMRFIEAAMELQETQFEIINVGLGHSISIKDLVVKVIQHSGKNLSIQFDPTKPTIPSRLVLDITKARQKFGWLPIIKLDEGIQRTLKWYRENIRS